MMECMTILAQVVETTVERPASDQFLNWMWENITHLKLLEAMTFISFGVVCLFYGWRVFKILVIISFALIGMFIGSALAAKLSGQQQQILGAVIGLILMALASIPLMKWAVSILGALAGGILTSGLWYACQLPVQYIWAGTLVGLIAGGMISFIVFKIAVMLFSSLGGGTLLVMGCIALLHIYTPTSAKIESFFFSFKWFLPVALIIPTAVGIAVQNKFIKGSRDWSL
jgi:hypothetical protein